MIDTDGNNKITKEELQGIFHSGLSNVGEDTMETLWNEILEDMDEDNDGAISFEEFSNSMTKVIK